MNNLNRIFVGILVVAILAGVGTGYLLSSGKKAGLANPNGDTGGTTTAEVKSAQQDAKTFRDFAEGTIQKKPQPSNLDDYSEGTHLLIRDGAQPVALTSSVVDLTQYEGKKVKVYGETQKALKEGWLMDVGRVDVE